MTKMKNTHYQPLLKQEKERKSQLSLFSPCTVKLSVRCSTGVWYWGQTLVDRTHGSIMFRCFKSLQGQNPLLPKCTPPATPGAEFFSNGIPIFQASHLSTKHKMRNLNYLKNCYLLNKYQGNQKNSLSHTSVGLTEHWDIKKLKIKRMEKTSQPDLLCFWHTGAWAQ